MQAVAVALVFMTLLLLTVLFFFNLLFFFFYTKLNKTWYSKENNLSPVSSRGDNGLAWVELSDSKIRDVICPFQLTSWGM